ncbi:hypothetical protein OFN23_14690, partial [Escherichia coli]|nr:hypothetical protein [Escherichia coli]
TDGDGSHGSTSKTPSYTKSVSWHHYLMIAPLESQSVNVKSNNANNWHLTIIDDHGNYISDKI